MTELSHVIDVGGATAGCKPKAAEDTKRKKNIGATPSVDSDGPNNRGNESYTCHDNQGVHEIFSSFGGLFVTFRHD